MEPAGYEFGYHAFDELPPIIFCLNHVEQVPVCELFEGENLLVEEVDVPLTTTEWLKLQGEDEFCKKILK